MNGDTDTDAGLLEHWYTEVDPEFWKYEVTWPRDCGHSCVNHPFHDITGSDACTLKWNESHECVLILQPNSQKAKLSKSVFLSSDHVQNIYLINLQTNVLQYQRLLKPFSSLLIGANNPWFKLTLIYLGQRRHSLRNISICYPPIFDIPSTNHSFKVRIHFNIHSLTEDKGITYWIINRHRHKEILNSININCQRQKP